MEFIENLFVDKNIKDYNTIIYSLKKGIPVFNTFVICVEEDSDSFAQIMNSKEIFKKCNENKKFKVIGIASGKASANSLFTEILEYWISKGEKIEAFKEKIVEE